MRIVIIYQFVKLLYVYVNSMLTRFFDAKRTCCGDMQRRELIFGSQAAIGRINEIRLAILSIKK
jgi:hypothetical protein